MHRRHQKLLYGKNIRGILIATGEKKINERTNKMGKLTEEIYKLEQIHKKNRYRKTTGTGK